MSNAHLEYTAIFDRPINVGIHLGTDIIKVWCIFFITMFEIETVISMKIPLCVMPSYIGETQGTCTYSNK